MKPDIAVIRRDLGRVDERIVQLCDAYEALLASVSAKDETLRGQAALNEDVSLRLIHAEKERDELHSKYRQVMDAARVNEDAPTVSGYDPSGDERTVSLRWPSGNLHCYDRTDMRTIDLMEAQIADLRAKVDGMEKDAANRLESAAEEIEAGHTWITAVSASVIIRKHAAMQKEQSAAMAKG